MLEKMSDYSKNYLQGPLFGPYSVLNISCGKEEIDDVHQSRKNILEVAVVTKLVENLYKAWKSLKHQFSVCILSPYTAQIVEIQDKLGQRYATCHGFIVNVRQLEDLRNKQEDVVIISTVRSNIDYSSDDPVYDEKITEMALTSARHCLWILGNDRVLSDRGSVWKSKVDEAKNKGCFFNVEEIEDLAKFVKEVKKELDEFDEMLDSESSLFQNAKWKVFFSQNFRKSFQRIKSFEMKKLVINLLLRLAGGWRPKKRKVEIICPRSNQILKKFKVKDLCVICSVDIVKESWYIQVLKVWDIIPLFEVQKLVNHLDTTIFGTYNEYDLKYYKEKRLDGDLEVPISWPPSCHIKKSSYNGEEIKVNAKEFKESSSVQNSKVSDSWFLMKFYPLSSNMVNHLLSGFDGLKMELPYELSCQEIEIIRFMKSSFILGRSGTGKTTVLVRKLFQIEQQYHIASEGFHEYNSCISERVTEQGDESVEETNKSFLRQIFVTFSAKLCYAVMQNLFHLRRFACGSSLNEESFSTRLDDVDNTMQFSDIPNSLIDLSSELYPLVITFHKFLLMLDGTVGISFFNKFPEARDDLNESTRSSRSLVFNTFIKMKEVTFEKFCSSYWPHFNKQLTKGLQSSVVHTEIMSYIKGGLRAVESEKGKLSREEYILLSESRISTISSQERDSIYDIFLQYECKKRICGEYDLADLVIDLHSRLREEKYKGDLLDFVYIDEVQDLTMRQIELFKYICKNVNDGFAFSGDTAQTIARGVDFRFEDIRCLFYKEFLMRSEYMNTSWGEKKGQIADIFQLSQNFRTHSGILKIAQSVIDLIYHFFPQSIDVLSPETSLVHGESPVILYSYGEVSFASIFVNGGDNDGNLVGFGANQVILVRDDSFKSKLPEHVQKQALVLTIAECKGLEFEDVLLYNFFSSSTLKTEWDVINEYLIEHNILDPKSVGYIPNLNKAKDKLLCYELKQLYVAITRTRQRLWIFENEGVPGPMYNYWKKLQVVEEQKLDDLLVRKMQDPSTLEEWKSRGIKLYYEHNYVSAKNCFERAGDEFWRSRAEASELRAAAHNVIGYDFKIACAYLTRAAEIFYSIDKAEAAAQCYFESKDYQRAGEIYLEKFGNTKLEEAGECFSRAGDYRRAAHVFAKGNLFSACLAACIKGKLFEEGLNYLHMSRDQYRNQIEEVAQKLLTTAARKYKKLGDRNTMMRFVKAFQSKSSMRNFLKSEGCLEELLDLETEWGNFLVAAKIANQLGRLRCASEMLEKANHFKEASLTILYYVFANSLWSSGSNGWPLKDFTEKQQLLHKAKALAEKVSDQFFQGICTEEKVLSNRPFSLSVLNQLFIQAKCHKSVRGVIISARKILDVHFRIGCPAYSWEDDLDADLSKQSEYVLGSNQVSVETLIYFWNMLKQNIDGIFQYPFDHKDNDDYEDFCSNYFGLIKQNANNKVIYLLICSDASWVKEVGVEFLVNESGIYLKEGEFVKAAWSYWRTEILSVWRKVLEKLKELFAFSRNQSQPYCQCVCQIHMFEVAKALEESEYLGNNYDADDKLIKSCIELSTSNFIENTFPLNCWTSKVMIIRRATWSCRNLIKNVICKIIDSKGQLTNEQIGNVFTTVLGCSHILTDELCYELVEMIDKSSWKSFFESLVESSSTNKFSIFPVYHVSLVHKFLMAMQENYYLTWASENNYMSPGSFVYLLERLMVMVFYSKGTFFCTRSSLIEWLVHNKWNKNMISEIVDDWELWFNGALDFLAEVVEELLYNKQDFLSWIEKSKLGLECHKLLVLRLFVVLCLLCVNCGRYWNLLIELLNDMEFTCELPLDFKETIQRVKIEKNVDNQIVVLAEALKKIGNPLVVVSSEEHISKPNYAIYVDLNTHVGKNSFIGKLFRFV